MELIYSEWIVGAAEESEKEKRLETIPTCCWSTIYRIFVFTKIRCAPYTPQSTRKKTLISRAKVVIDRRHS